MSQIKEVNTLGTIASIRKATQDSLKPIIEEISRKMGVMNKQTMQLASKTEKISQLQKRQNRTDESIRYIQSQLLQIKQHCQSMQIRQNAEKQARERSEQTTREQFRKVNKDKEKQDIVLQTMQDRNQRMNKELNTALQSMKSREQVLETRFKALTERSEALSFQVRAGAQKMNLQFQQIKHTLNHQLKENSRRLSLLDMYQAQKDFTSKKIKEISDELEQTVKQQQFEFYKQCNSKQLQRVIHTVKTMIQDNLSQKTRQILLLLPQMREQLLFCLQFQKGIDSIKRKISELHNLISENRLQIDMNQNRFKTNVYDRLLAAQQQRISMKKDISKALGFQSQMVQKLDQYSEKLKDQLRKENQRKSRELYEQIKISFADKKQEIRQKQLKKIVQQRHKLFDRAQQMENLANKIGQLLTNFSTRITKIKSDNQIFVDKVKKQLLAIDVLRKIMNSNNSLIGQTLSQLIQSILISNCIQIEKQSKPDQQIAFSTHYDGVIYQKYIHHKQPDFGNLIYRRKIANSKLLKRSIVAALTHVYDKLMDEENCLCWHQHSPSNYFKDAIQPIYKNLSQKLQGDESEKNFKSGRGHELDTLTVRQRDTILTTFENIDASGRKPATTHRSRRTRYEDNTIFLAKSARRVRGSINTTTINFE